MSCFGPLQAHSTTHSSGADDTDTERFLIPKNDLRDRRELSYGESSYRGSHTVQEVLSRDLFVIALGQSFLPSNDPLPSPKMYAVSVPTPACSRVSWDS